MLLAACLTLLAGQLPVDDEAPPALDLRNPRHVRALYLDTLGRTPDDDELALARAARPEALLALLTDSPEAWEHWYEEQLHYLLLLDNLRPDDPADPADGIPARLAAGALDVLAALRELCLGSAFHRANPGNDTFVSVVFEQLLGLTVQDHVALLEAGKRMYDGRPASLWGREGKSQADVVAIALEQPACAEHFVRREHERVVGLPAAPADVQRWAAELRARPGRYSALVAGWLASPAYAERLAALRHKSDRQFVRGLWIDLLGRLPEREVMQRYRTALAAVADGGPLRAVIARVLIDSEGVVLPPYGLGESVELVRDVFGRFLGRPPEPEELAALVLLRDQGGASPQAIVRAVTTHPEYQYY